MKFMNSADYQSFVAEYQDHLFENVHGLPPIDENKINILAKTSLSGPEEMERTNQFGRKQRMSLRRSGAYFVRR